MSRIKQLDLKGFKSFANPTTLIFEKGFNTVVGANGSGKSNVFDALCFVLGRISSKGLRADRLGNLVFNGGKYLKSSKEARVDLFLENKKKELLNTKLDEIKISRVVKKSGVSKYFLNDKVVTRSKIVELLNLGDIDPNGYNVILQGDIQRIVNMSSNERRELVEDIANISGYEEKKEKGLKKLEVIQNDLKQADLLMGEKAKYLKELRAEKEQAEKFHKVKEKLYSNHILLLKSRIHNNNTSRTKKEEEVKTFEEKIKSQGEELEGISEEINSTEQEITKLEKQIEISSHKDFIKITNSITKFEQEHKNLLQKRAEYSKQTKELEKREEGVKKNILSNRKQIDKINQGIEKLEARLKKKQENIKKIEDKILILKKNLPEKNFELLEEIDTELESLFSEKQNKLSIQTDNTIQKEKLNSKIEVIQKELEKLKSVEGENSSKIKEREKNEKKIKALTLEVTKLATTASELASKLNSLNKEQEELLSKIQSLEVKSHSSRDFLSQNRAVSTILNFKKEDTNIHGALSEIIKVPEKYSTAVEIISGRALFNIVVENDTTAIKYINYLKEHKIGSVTFLPLNKIRAKYPLPPHILNKRGVVGYIANEISYDRKYENIIHLVFSNTLLIEKIEDAKNIGIGTYKMVTLTGDTIAKSGAMSGGFRARRKNTQIFESGKIKENIQKHRKTLDTLQKTIEELKLQKQECENSLYKKREEKHELEGENSKIEKILSISGKGGEELEENKKALLQDREIIQNSLLKVSKEIEKIEGEIKRLQKKKSQFKVENSKNSKVISDINKLEEEKSSFKESQIKTNSQINEKKLNVEKVLEVEISRLERIEKETSQSIKSIKSSILEIDNKARDVVTKTEELKKQEKELSKDYKEFIGKRDSLKNKKTTSEKKYEKEFTKLSSLKEKVAQINYILQECETRNETLISDLTQIEEDIKIQLSEEKLTEFKEKADKRIQSSINITELQQKVNSLKSQLSSFGAINLKAVEMYDTINKEFQNLLSKRETLRGEEKEITDLIAQMDSKKQEKFMETFTQLRKHFIQIFSKLSDKGDAELNLENEKDIFEGGIEIKVKLSKRNYLDIKSLSGGEKTITAIAFIFAVQEFNPASFYIFDEVDAALDILNCEKLGKLIRKNSSKAQYIVVSHSEHLIQSAQSIYGVVMDANKVSSVVSLDLRGAEEHLEAEG